MGKKAKSGPRRKTLAALIAAEPDKEKKQLLNWWGRTAMEHNDPAVQLAIEFSILRKSDARLPIVAAAGRDAWKRFRKQAAKAIDEGRPQFFERFARSMRRAERFEFEPLYRRTPDERYKWADLLLEMESAHPNIRQLARNYCRIHHGDPDKLESKVESLERKFRELKARFFPP